MADFFISHASEDKEVARALAQALADRGHSVWFDETSLVLGDSLRAEIDRGLNGAHFGIVLLSPHFFAKAWPQAELDALFAREAVDRTKRILPVWHNLDAATVVAFSPVLAARLGISTSRGIPLVVDEVERALHRRIAAAAQPGEPSIDLRLRIDAPSLGKRFVPPAALHFHSEVTVVNRGHRPVVLNFEMRFDLDGGDPRQWVAIPEGPQHERQRVRIERDDFAVCSL